MYLFNPLPECMEALPAESSEGTTDRSRVRDHIECCPSLYHGDRHHLEIRTSSIDRGRRMLLSSELFPSFCAKYDKHQCCIPTWESRGSTSLATMFCRLTTEEEAARIGSIDCWGKAAWPPLPQIVALKLPHPARNSPGRDATAPIGYLCTTCIPKIASTFSRAPSLIICLAPSPRSSAGWNMRTTVPCESQQSSIYEITMFLNICWSQGRSEIRINIFSRLWLLTAKDIFLPATDPAFPEGS